MWSPHIQQAGQILTKADPKVKSHAGRTNVLLLGIGGENHESPDLTDSIIVASIPTNQNIQNQPISLVSLPRDIYLTETQSKINALYSVEKEKHSQDPFLPIKNIISNLTGLPIHYVVTLDFQGFVQAIDLLGGLDLTVDQGFEDIYYPIPGKETDLCENDPQFRCRYETLKFESGQQHLNGTQALKFARSRYSQSSEGSDFSRAKRQQKIIEAIAAKIFSLNILLDPNQTLQIYEVLKNHIVSDIDTSQIVPLTRLAIKYKSTGFSPIVLDEDLFINPPIDYRGWILLPKDPSYKEINNFILNRMTNFPAQIEGN